MDISTPFGIGMPAGTARVADSGITPGYTRCTREIALDEDVSTETDSTYYRSLMNRPTSPGRMASKTEHGMSYRIVDGTHLN